MVYGDLQFFDIIIFAGIAGFLIYRLRNVLGKRNGFEKNQRAEKFAKREEEPKTKFIKKTFSLKENEKKLELAYKTLSDFEHKSFLEGAKYAFETIINAFNNGDKTTLKNLLTKDVFRAFSHAIDGGNNNPGFQFYSLTIDGVEDVLVEADTISVTIKITSEQFKDNDENTITKKQDTWTFQKKINSNSPIWLLSST